MDKVTWSNTPGSPYYQPDIDEILELEFGIDIKEYYAAQANCQYAHAFYRNKKDRLTRSM